MKEHQNKFKATLCIYDTHDINELHIMIDDLTQNVQLFLGFTTIDYCFIQSVSLDLYLWLVTYQINIYHVMNKCPSSTILM